MRILCLRQHTFEGYHANFLKFEQDLRSTRVSALALTHQRRFYTNRFTGHFEPVHWG